MPEVTSVEWDRYLGAHPEAHLLQTSAWGELKAAHGWTPVRVLSHTAENSAAQAEAVCGAQVLFRRAPLGFTLAYIPRGPVGEDWNALWPEVDAACRRRRAFLLKVEPDVWEPGRVRLPPAFHPSRQTIQPPRTLVVDLSGGEEAVLGRMKQKARYNVRLALKRGIVVRASADLEVFHRLMLSTSERDQFGVHTLEYYRRAYELFYPLGMCELLQAEYLEQPLAALMVFARGERAWYLYGASADEHRELMPTYLLQWEAMRWAQARGCRQYDLWGAPDETEDILEAAFTERTEGLWGVYRFKRGFGGKLMRSVGTQDRVFMPALNFIYQLYTRNRTQA